MLNIGMYKATIKTPIMIPITTIISGSIIIESPLTTVSNSSFVFFVTAKISVFLILTIQSCIF